MRAALAAATWIGGRGRMGVASFAVTCLIFAATCLTFAVAVRAQGPLQFRGGIDVVHVDVSVLDKDRRPVRGLTAADFRVLEDGAPRPIVTFAPVELPGAAPASTPAASAAWLRDVPVDVATNQIGTEGRLIAIVFDWSIRFADQPLARRIARAAVANMGSQDLAALIFASGFSNAGTSQNFTGDRARLLEAIDRPMTPAREGIDSDPGAPPPQDRQTYPWLFDPDGEASGDCLCRVCVFDKVGDVADAVAGIPGRRKTMLFIGTYFPPVSPNPVNDRGCAGHVRQARERLTGMLSRANVTIHVVDPAGVPDLFSGPVPGDRDTANAAGWPHRDGLEPMTEMSRVNRLPFLANLTGGRVVMNDNGAEATVPAILEETSSYYVLAFQSADRGAVAGRTHKIEVQVTRRDVTLQFRKTYQDGQTPAAIEASARRLPLVRSLEATLPRTDQSLTLSAAPFAVPGQEEAAVAVVLRTEPPEAGEVAAPPGMAGVREDRASIVVAAVDAQGKVLGTVTQSAAVPWRPGGSTPAPYELLSRVELKPGRYEIRAASDLASGQRSSVYGFVEIPDFARAPVSMSGIVIQALPSGMAGPKDTFSTQSFASIPLPVVPTARRAFFTTDRVTAFLRVYSKDTVRPPPVVVAQIVTSEGRVAQENRLEPEGSGYQIDVPVEILPPGEYLLQVRASTGNETASREMRFTIR